MQEFSKNNKIDFARFSFAVLTVFFFLISPVALFTNTHLGIALDNLALAILIVLAIAILIVLNRKKELFILPEVSELKKATTENYPILIALLGYFLLHILTFYFYTFIPEWDSYSDLVNINRILTSGFTDITYRPLFTMTTALLSSLTIISPYHVFSIIFTIIQLVILVVAYKLLKIYEVKNKILQLFFLLGIISIPALSMEIDMVRPQNIFIIFFPIYIYYLHDFLVTRKLNSFILSSLIAFFGPSYHEFFIFIFIFHLVTFCFLGYKRFIQGRITPRKTFLLVSVGIMFIALIPKIAYHSSVVANFFSIIRSASQRMLDFEKWRIWFINSYWSDSELLQMGWSGITGALKYYAYYASPFILFLIGFIILFFLFRNKFDFAKNKLYFVTFPFFVLFFFFAEISPRLNYHYLPERYWIFIDITLIFLAIPTLKYFEDNIRISKKIFMVVCLCILVGLSGTIYIAHGKKSLTSESEYVVSQWIKENTPSDSLFISQSANSPLIQYFSNRKMLYPTESFFLGTEIEKEPRPEKIIETEKLKSETLHQMRKDFDSYIFGAIGFDAFETKLRGNKILLTTYQSILERQLPKINRPTYILYSTDKFKTIYTQREWWRKSNFYQANLEKFDKNFKIVYQNNAVKIWQIQ